MGSVPEIKLGKKVAYTRPDGQTVEAAVIGAGPGYSLLAPIPGTELFETVDRIPHSSQLKTAFWEPLPDETPAAPPGPIAPQPGKTVAPAPEQK